MESSSPLGRWAQPEAPHEHAWRSRRQPNAQPTHTLRYAQQAPYPARRALALHRASRSNQRSAEFPNPPDLLEATSGLGLPTDFASARVRSYEAPEESTYASLGTSRCSGQIECAINRLYECALFAKDDALRFRRREVCARLRIGFQLLSVRFVGCKAIESN